MALLLFLSVALCAGALGAFFSPGLSPASAAWYAVLVKPPWTPPDRWFAVMWPLLYLTMSIAAWLVWRERYHRVRNTALLAYGVQLLLNAAWSPLFFGARNIGVGLFVIVALWLSLAWTVREFAAVRPAAAWLMIPTLAWVGFASALNLSIWRHNLMS